MIENWDASIESLRNTAVNHGASVRERANRAMTSRLINHRVNVTVKATPIEENCPLYVGKVNTVVTRSQTRQSKENGIFDESDQNDEQTELNLEEGTDNLETGEILPPVDCCSPINPVTQTNSSTLFAEQQNSEELAPLNSEVSSKTDVDAYEPMPASTEGNNKLLTIRCFAFKYPEVIPVSDKTSKSVIQALLQVFRRMGFPREIQSDKGKSIMSRLTVEFFKKVNIKISKSSIFRPQRNTVERFHRSVKLNLKASCIAAAILLGVKLKGYYNKQTEFSIQTGHNSLASLKNNAGSNVRVRLLFVVLSLKLFNIPVVHVKGKENLNGLLK
ncbi:retrovirus-related Pol polyprotein from transposon 17.6 [Trichonephila clavipes]|nr:retrovirus-related Pol polyprotein from transposon 17.6 [Trichonephila clavipes]